MFNAIKQISSLPDTLSSQKETAMSDLEIARRVHLIQSQWSNQERAKRRLEAERRMHDLLDTLTGPAA